MKLSQLIQQLQGVLDNDYDGEVYLTLAGGTTKRLVNAIVKSEDRTLDGWNTYRVHTIEISRELP